MAHVKEAGFYKRRLSLCGAGVVGVPVFGARTSRIDVFALSSYKLIRHCCVSVPLPLRPQAY